MLCGYADEHLHFGIVAGLRRRGMDVVRVQERGQCGMDDEILLATATAETRLMLSNDQDFLIIHHNWQAAGRTHTGIIYWHQTKLPVREAIRRIIDYATLTAPADAANVVHYL